MPNLIEGLFWVSRIFATFFSRVRVSVPMTCNVIEKVIMTFEVVEHQESQKFNLDALEHGGGSRRGS